ncbi:hypothetical protein VN97_g2770 [Penicillium thymicola]|uniref:Uncharacterized protein n=1 Tax=Penicillium thymicola TaxID=293382 RepID=A0AAI9TNI1_PENTH|nr:hypothetical protein VN97_g2770 [Penicillium thymicola]
MNCNFFRRPYSEDLSQHAGPMNALTLTYHHHRLFNEFEIYFERTGTRHQYRIDSTQHIPFLRDPLFPETRSLTLSPHRTVDPPSPRLLDVHRAIALIMKLSAAGEYIERVLRDMEELEVRADGSTHLGYLLTGEVSPQLCFRSSSTVVQKNSEYRLLVLAQGAGKSIEECAPVSRRTVSERSSSVLSDFNVSTDDSHLLQAPGQAEQLMKKEFASIGFSVSPMTLCNEACASTGAKSPVPKIGIIKVFPGRKLSEIKLKRTDTTLDLSQ